MDERRERKYQQEMLQRGSSNVIGDPRSHPRPFIWPDMTNVADSLIACSSFFFSGRRALVSSQARNARAFQIGSSLPLTEPKW